MTQKTLNQTAINSSTFDYIDDNYFEDIDITPENIADEFYVNATNIIKEFEVDCNKIIGEIVSDEWNDELEEIIDKQLSDTRKNVIRQKKN